MIEHCAARENRAEGKTSALYITKRNDKSEKTTVRSEGKNVREVKNYLRRSTDKNLIPFRFTPLDLAIEN